jgi:hypothetical protein
MRVIRPLISFLGMCLLSFLASAQQSSSTATTTTPERDVQAVTLLQQSIAAFGSVQPSDSTATGSVIVTAGSSTTQGAVTILTKGSAETSIQFQMPNDPWTVIFANGQANKVASTQTTAYPLELAASSQCLYFPLPYLLGVLNSSDYSMVYIGQEAVGSSTANHIVVQNTFTSSPTFQFLSSFTVADIWLDASSALPVKIAMVRRFGGGSAPQIPFSIAYSNYQAFAGVRYPLTIQEYVTGTLWATTAIQSVTFNTGLTDSNFPVTQGAN